MGMTSQIRDGIKRPVTVTIVTDLPAPGFMVTLPILKVPVGFQFNSTSFGIMMNLEQLPIGTQCTALMDSVRDMLFDLKANGKSLVAVVPPEQPRIIPAVPYVSTYRNISVTSWPYGGAPADFFMTLVENEMLELEIQNNAFAPAWPVVTPRLLVGLNGWYAEIAHKMQ